MTEEKAWPPRSDSSNDDTEHQEAWDDWEDNEGEGFGSLFSDARLGSVKEVLAHDLQATGFNLQQYRAQVGHEKLRYRRRRLATPPSDTPCHSPCLQRGLDQVGTIRLINYIRAVVAVGQDPLPALQGGTQPWSDDAYLRPFLPDDGLLFHDWEEDEEEEERRKQGAGQGAADSAPAAAGGGSEVAALQAENEALRAVVESMRTVVLQDQALREMLVEERHSQGASTSASASAGGSGAKAAAGNQQQPGAAGPAGQAAQRIDESYFDSYSTFGIHREMLADKVHACLPYVCC
jgi:protein arginine N-methyltransferase 3